MKVVTKQERIDGVVESWKAQYWHRLHTGRAWTYKWAEEKFEKLSALVDPTEGQIAEIIGNTMWTENKCEECRKDSDVLIWLGGGEDSDEYDYVEVCIECLQKAIDLAQGAVI